MHLTGSAMVLCLLALPATAQDYLIQTEGDTAIVGDIWVDNWFFLSVNGTPVFEDSTPYMTERSFNADSIGFNADLPMTLAFEFRDFKENDTGLEYIGTDRQQTGDGGAIAQFRNAETGDLLAATNADWRCKTVHTAPVDPATCAASANPVEGEGACASVTEEIPADWTAPDFDDSDWDQATVHSSAAVAPKDGYHEIEWSSAAEFIWSDDLVLDNTVLCRMTVGG